MLTWGNGGYPGSYPFGDPQGTTSTSAVTDTGSTAALLGVGVLVLAFARRRLG
ncbi:VPDSG-CTERM sorting domain-containing protein [Candidatus Pelagisphaera phototrophica]|uniref:VPDSG-CTERM sorting domain-containing protein n=1 Tax=Candidatus Pelagisphaera phototrophica TaxID=2684113 RepID=UPI0019E95351|nr:VPDSG-CTERM sorting domain-containing protein [Candidatus Pelagisphaera phototrophica]